MLMNGRIYYLKYTKYPSINLMWVFTYAKIDRLLYQFSSVAHPCLTLLPHGLQHARPPCTSPTPGVHTNPCPLCRWCHPTISSSVVPFSRFQSFPASGSFQMSQFFASSGQSIGTSASASFLPMDIQDWFPLGWTGLILQSKGLKSLLQCHSSKASILQHSTFFIPANSKANLLTLLVGK